LAIVSKSIQIDTLFNFTKEPNDTNTTVSYVVNSTAESISSSTSESEIETAEPEPTQNQNIQSIHNGYYSPEEIQDILKSDNPRVNYTYPATGQQFYTIYEDGFAPYVVLEMAGNANDNIGQISSNSIQWFVELSNGQREYIGTGEHVIAKYTFPTCPTNVIALVERVTGHTGLVTERRGEIYTHNYCPEPIIPIEVVSYSQ